MTRDDLEARIWAITGRELTGVMVDALVDTAEEYATELHPAEPRMVLHRPLGETELYPVIGLLAGLLLGDEAPQMATVLPLPLREAS